MTTKSSNTKKPAERVMKDIRSATRGHFSAEDKIRIVLDVMRGEDSIAELCRKEGIAQSLYYTWSKESWRPASAAWLVIQRVLPPVMRSKICAARLVRSGNAWPT